MKPEIKSMSLFEWLLLIILSSLWGGPFFFVGVEVKVLPPLTIVALRVFLAAITLLTVVHVTSLRMPANRKVSGTFFGMCILNNIIPFSLIVWGQQHIACGLASILNATTPLFIYFHSLATAGATNVLLVTLLIPVSTILLGTIFLGENLETKHLLGMRFISVRLLAIDGRVFRLLRTTDP